MTARPTRRDVLAGAALAVVGIGTGALAGRRSGATAPADGGPSSPHSTAPTRSRSAAATPSSSPTSAPGSDHPLVQAYLAEAKTVATYTGLIPTLSSTVVAGRLSAVAVDHRRHLDALGAAAAVAVPGWTPPAAPAGRRPPIDVAALERDASAAHLALVAAASGDDAGLLASIAAAEAAHAQFVGSVRHT